jgi:hypothetical protein
MSAVRHHVPNVLQTGIQPETNRKQLQPVSTRLQCRKGEWFGNLLRVGYPFGMVANCHVFNL